MKAGDYSADRTAAATAALRLHDAHYRRLIQLLRPRRQMRPESVLACAEQAAYVAGSYHTGRFADGAVERPVMEIGAGLDRQTGALPPPRPARRAGRTVLHVVTAVLPVGGHTRTIRNWILADASSVHSVVMTRQGRLPIPDGLREVVETRGGQLWALPGGARPLQRARQLRAAARSGYDLIVLHHAGYDTTPLVAFADPGCPPVAVLNHADHIFWLGSSVADLIINQREEGRRLCEDRRYVARNAVLPIPLTNQASPITKRAARAALGIPSDQLVLLTVGRAEKYRPTPHQDFFRTATAVLERVPEGHLYFVGTDSSAAVRFSSESTHPRMHYCGEVDDATVFQSAADLYLEGFPFGSSTALLETARRGVPVVLPFAPPFELLVTNHGLGHLVQNPDTEAEYIDRVGELAASPDLRRHLGARLSEHVNRNHTEDGWRAHLASVYDQAAHISHSPKPIPDTLPCLTTADLAMSEWHSLTARGSDAADRDIREIVKDNVYEARERGAYRDALLLLGHCGRHWGVDAGMLAAACKLPIHWARRQLRQVTGLSERLEFAR